MQMEVEGLLMCLDKKFGGTGKNLSDISYLEFRKRLYKKYYVEEEDDI